MSIRLMNAAWRMAGMNPGQKLVLIALCDNASDEGACFPSVTTIAEKCSMGVRTVQQHLKTFEDAGILTRHERPGRSTMYFIDLRKFSTHAETAPPQKLHPTTAEFAPPPPQFLHPTPAVSAPITINETSIEPSGNQKTAPRKRSTAPSAPDGVTDQVWSDWLAVRKSKKAAVTSTAVDGIKAEAIKAGMTLQQALETCCRQGWAGFKAAWVADQNQGQRQQPSRHDKDERDRLAMALLWPDEQGNVIEGDVR